MASLSTWKVCILSSVPTNFSFLFWDRISLCNSSSCPGTSSCRPGWPHTHREPPASGSRVLGLKVCTTTAQLRLHCILEVINSFNMERFPKCPCTFFYNYLWWFGHNLLSRAKICFTMLYFFFCFDTRSHDVFLPGLELLHSPGYPGIQRDPCLFFSSRIKYMHHQAQLRVPIW